MFLIINGSILIRANLISGSAHYINLSASQFCNIQIKIHPLYSLLCSSSITSLHVTYDVSMPLRYNSAYHTLLGTKNLYSIERTLLLRK